MLTITRVFTTANTTPYIATIPTKTVRAEIKDMQGNIVFEMDNVVVPVSWGQTAVNTFASKYLRKAGVPQPDGTLGSENSVRQVVHRIAHTIRNEGLRLKLFDEENGKAFYDELCYLLLNQMLAFNSPVWFNVGLWHEYGIKGPSGYWGWQEKGYLDEDTWISKGEAVEVEGMYTRPAASACFIHNIEDSMDGIYESLTTESKIFRAGSGAGANYSKIRGKDERLSGGGKSSGLISFLEVFDKSAGAIKSGGITRRAARLVAIDADHPEILEFIQWKVKEERKAKALISKGYEKDFNGEAYQTISGQNANNSVCVTDAFMNAVESDSDWALINRTDGKVCSTVKAAFLFEEIAKAAWECADPGILFTDTINAYNKVPHIDKIKSSNPCQPAWAPVLTRKGIQTLGSVMIGDEIWSGTSWTKITAKWSTGVKPVFKYHTKAGIFTGTENHRVVSSGDKIEAKEAISIDICVGNSPSQLVLDSKDVLSGLLVGDGSAKVCNDGRQTYTLLFIGEKDQDYFNSEIASYIQTPAFDKTSYRVESCLPQQVLRARTYDRTIPDEFYYGTPEKVAGFLRGLYSANGSICGDRITLKTASFSIVEGVQTMLSSIGIRSYYTTNKPKDVTFDNGTYTCKQSYDVNITTDRNIFKKLIGFIQEYKTEKLEILCTKKQLALRNKNTYEITEIEDLGEHEVFDITVQAEEHVYWTGGLLVSNCAEFVHIDNTACNLACINLLKFLTKEGEFKIAEFKTACIISIIAQEILVDLSSYPTRKIAENSHKMRPLGLGYTNLGALLMCSGMAYDSEDGRFLAGAITSLMTATAYGISALLAKELGTYEYYDRSVCSSILQKHAKCTFEMKERNFGEVGFGTTHTLFLEANKTWDQTLQRLDAYGLRNTDVTLLMPAGTVGLLMESDTLGIEPDYALTKYKLLAGGGSMVLLNKSVDRALAFLGYNAQERAALEFHLQEHSTLVGSLLKTEHLAIFDCAAEDAKGRSILPMGHIRMLAAVQPFLTMAISKTINCPESTTVEEIKELYLNAWRLSLKCISVYRDNCKGSQPLSSTKPGTQESSPEKAFESPSRELHRQHLPRQRKGTTSKVTVSGQSFYITAGEYADGSLGEIFLTSAKSGSTMQGLLNAVAISVSIGLQYGIPLEEYVQAFLGTSFAPNGITDDSQFRFTSSFLDYTFKLLQRTYCKDTKLPSEGKVEITYQIPEVKQQVLTGDCCNLCGGLLIQSGSCKVCSQCAVSTGCS